jgi:hypothetical protein
MYGMFIALNFRTACTLPGYDSMISVYTVVLLLPVRTQFVPRSLGPISGGRQRPGEQM